MRQVRWRRRAESPGTMSAPGFGVGQDPRAAGVPRAREDARGIAADAPDRGCVRRPINPQPSGRLADNSLSDDHDRE